MNLHYTDLAQSERQRAKCLETPVKVPFLGTILRAIISEKFNFIYFLSGYHTASSGSAGSSLPLQQQLEHANQKSGFGEEKFKMAQVVGHSGRYFERQRLCVATSA